MEEFQQAGGDTSTEADGSQTNYQESSTQQEQALAELEGMERFKFDGREWSPDELKKAVMRQSDYTRKTQEISESKKWYSNLNADLAKIRSNPQLIAEFKQIYPKQFHEYADGILAVFRAQQKEQPEGSQKGGGVDEALRSELNQIKEYIKEKEVSAIEAQLDQKFSVLQKKYPDAVEDLVVTKAQILAEQGVQLTDVVWDKLWKQSNDFMRSRVEKNQADKFNKQKAANNQAREAGRGGGAPGQAPKRMSMKEATDHAIRSLTGRS